jgi:hypothetical protein
MKEIDLSDEGFFLSELDQNITGLPVIFCARCGGLAENCNPFIRIMPDNSDKFNVLKSVKIWLKHNITSDEIIDDIIISNDIINVVRDYININYDILLDHWYDENSTCDLPKLLKRLNT